MSAGSVSFHCIEVHNQSRTPLKVWAILSALKMIVWLTETNLNTTDFRYSSLAGLIPGLLLLIKEHKLTATHCCPELCLNTSSLAWLYGAVIVLLGSRYIGVGPGFFSLYLKLVAICSLIRVSDSYKDTWVYYKKTLINTDLLFTSI